MPPLATYANRLYSTRVTAALLFVVASRLCRASVDTQIVQANPAPGALAAGSSV